MFFMFCFIKFEGNMELLRKDFGFIYEWVFSYFELIWFIIVLFS